MAGESLKIVLKDSPDSLLESQEKFSWHLHDVKWKQILKGGRIDENKAILDSKSWWSEQWILET